MAVQLSQASFLWAPEDHIGTGCHLALVDSCLAHSIFILNVDLSRTILFQNWNIWVAIFCHEEGVARKLNCNQNDVDMQRQVVWKDMENIFKAFHFLYGGLAAHLYFILLFSCIFSLSYLELASCYCQLENFNKGS